MTRDQHVDVIDSSVKREKQNINKLLTWVSALNLFPEIPKFVSIAIESSVIDINCHNARKVVVTSMTRRAGQIFTNIL